MPEAPAPDPATTCLAGSCGPCQVDDRVHPNRHSTGRDSNADSVWSCLRSRRVEHARGHSWIERVQRMMGCVGRNALPREMRRSRSWLLVTISGECTVVWLLCVRSWLGGLLFIRSDFVGSVPKAL
jgi:hypothetical protein